MKKTILSYCLVTLIALSSFPVMAQLNGSGYYRFRNVQYPNDYISMVNDKFNYTTIMDDAGGGLTSLATSDEAAQRAVLCSVRFLQNDIHMAQDPDIIDLSSVIYAKKNVGNEYNLIGQGTSLVTLTSGTFNGKLLFFSYSLKFELYATLTAISTETDPVYTASIHLKPSNLDLEQADLGLRYFVDENGKFDNDMYNSPEATPTKARWYIEPVTHFNVQPEVELNGKYYTTLKVPFAINLGNGVEKAYAITAVNNGILEYREITEFPIPAGTPVLLQCSSDNIADCQIIPTGVPVFTAPNVDTTSGAPAATDVIAPTSDNLLIGTYYCNTDGQLPFTNSNGGTSYINGDHYTSSSNKYVIGYTESGKLGFVEATGSTMPANKAWLEIADNAEFPTVATPTIVPAAGDYTEGQSVTITAEDGVNIHYTTDGSEPTMSSPIYTDEITVDQSMTIKAIGIKEGLYNNSDVAEATYVITPLHKPGDVNHDGNVTIKDVTLLINYLLTDDPEGVCLTCADVSEDDDITIKDVTMLINILLTSPD